MRPPEPGRTKPSAIRMFHGLHLCREELLNSTCNCGFEVNFGGMG